MNSHQLNGYALRTGPNDPSLLRMSEPGLRGPLRGAQRH